MGSIKCDSCGKFISYEDLESKKATTYFEPDSHFGPEIIEFTCKKCNERPTFSEETMRLARNNLKKYKKESEESFLVRARLDREWGKFLT